MSDRLRPQITRRDLIFKVALPSAVTAVVGLIGMRLGIKPVKASTPAFVPIPEDTVEPSQATRSPQLTQTPQEFRLIGEYQISEKTLDSAIIPFINAAKMAKIELTPEAVKSDLTVKELKDKDRNPLLIAIHQFKPEDASRNGEMLEKPTPLVLSRDGGKTWEVCDSALLCRTADIDTTSRISISNPELTKRVATKVQLEVGTDIESLFNQNFDWERITSNWETIVAQLKSGTIPFTDEIFNMKKVKEIQQQVDYATRNNMGFVGNTLFYPAMIYQKYFQKMSPEKQKKVLLFMAAARILKFPEISEIGFASEVAAHILWKDDFKRRFDQLGGVTFLSELAKFAKEIRPEVRLIIDEDLDLQGVNASTVEQYELFFGILRNLKQSGAPVDKVKFQNLIWIRIPPTNESVARPIRQAQNLGYEIGAPDTIIAISKQHPADAPNGFWRPTTGYPENPLYSQGLAHYTIFSTYLQNGASELGIFNITDNDDWTGDNSSNLFDKSGNPKFSYYLLMTSIYEYLLNKVAQQTSK